MGAIFTTNSPKSTKSTKNPIAQWSFQRNHESSICTAKSPFAVNRGLNYDSDRHSGVYYYLCMALGNVQRCQNS